jgi:Leucine rich repeat variant
MEAYLPRFLANPETILAALIDLQLAIANYIDTPAQLLAVLVNSPDQDVAAAAGLHITWAGEIELNRARIIDDLLKAQQLGQNDRLAVELLKLGTVPPCFVSEWVPPTKIVESLDLPHMPLEYKIQFLERLARADRLDIVVPVAGSIDSPPLLLAQLIGSVHLVIRDTARNNPSCPPEAIELIDRTHEVAASWDTDPAQLAIVATSHWDWIRWTVAQNLSSNAETLMALAQDEIYRIRVTVANNPHTPAAVLQVLADNNEGEIRSLVAKHLQTSEETLHQLFSDCRNVLQSRSDLPLSILERFFEERDRQKALWEDYATREFLLRNSQTSAELLAELATDYLDEIRANRAALNPSNSEVLGTWVLEATDYLARIVQHPNIGVETLTDLASHYNPKVRLAVGLNQRTPEAIRFNILEQLGCHPIRLDFRRSVMSDLDIKKVIAGDLNTPVDILRVMAENELIDNKVKIEARKTLEIYCPEGSDWYDTSNDLMISRLKDEILNPVGIVVDSERWVELIPIDGISSFQDSQSQWRASLPQFSIVPDLGVEISSNNLNSQQIESRWRELLPQLSSESVKRVIGTVCTISDNIRNFLQRDPYRNTVIALLGNPRTPENLREQLLEQYQQQPEVTRYVDKDFPLRFALATNLSVPEARRREYLRQLSDRPYLADSIAKASNIPQNLLLELLDIDAGFRQAISRNPNAPHSLLLELSKDSNSTTRNWVAENPSTPLDILLTLTNDGALNNPNFPALERYRVTLENNLANERQNASTLIANLPLKTKLSLTQVVEGSELPAKLAIARDLQTPIDILERLAQDPNEDVRATVASNRSLPLATLLKLADDSSRKVKLQLVRQQSNRSIPIEILAKLADDPDTDIKTNIASNSNTPTEVLAKLAFVEDPYRWITGPLARNPNTSVETLEYLGVERHVVNAHNKKTPPNALAAQVDYALTQHSKAQNDIFEFLLRDLDGSQMPASSLVKLATNYQEWIRARVACHRNTPLTTLEQLSNDKSYDPILWGLARNPNSSPALLEKLLRENYENVAGCMVERAIIPPNIMGRLLENESDFIRSRVVSRNNFPLDLADRVINTETHNSVLISLARNPILTSELISGFIQQHGLKPDICIALLYQPNLTTEHWQQLANSQFEPVRLAIASRQNTPIDILAMLADNRELPIRMAIASNLQTPSDIFVKLATDSEAEVRTKIASNPQSPTSILEALAVDPSVEVRRSVLNNPQTPASIRNDLEDIFGRKPIPTTIDTLRDLPHTYDPANDDLTTILTEYAQSENNFVRLVSLLHPLMPAEVIETAVRSPRWSDRYAVAKNPSTPNPLRQSLAQDSNRIVRAMASMTT